MPSLRMQMRKAMWENTEWVKNMITGVKESNKLTRAQKEKQLAGMRRKAEEWNLNWEDLLND